jgi:ribonucleoside-diphosphate reductase alpha subunit
LHKLAVFSGPGPPTPSGGTLARQSTTMYVLKRSGERQQVHFDKITERIRTLCEMEPRLGAVDPADVAQKVIQGLRTGMTTQELDLLASKTLAYRTIDHPDYGALAARIEVSNLQKSTAGDFGAVTEQLAAAGLLRDEYLIFVRRHREELAGMIDYARDYRFDYFGIKTLQRSYLMDVPDGKGTRTVERPQDMWMRVAIEVAGLAGWPSRWPSRLAALRVTYDQLSLGYYTHATPTLYSAGTHHNQMSSCFLLDLKDDSIAGIFETLGDCAQISKHAGGIGLAISKVRATGSYIRSTNGRSNGIVPMLRIFNNTARYVDQGGGKRKGSFAMYLEPWHADVEEFLELKKNHGKEEARARDLFYALWVPDLFMKRVEARGTWSLFCPHEAPGLTDVYGDEFEALYTRYEAEGRARKQIPALILWQAILSAQIETGTPYVLFKDHINRKSQQANIGVIRSSNLCAEIVEHTNPGEVAVCNLASINLARFVILGEEEQGKSRHDEWKDAEPAGRRRPPDCPSSESEGQSASPAPPTAAYDFDSLRATVRTAVRNLNNVIDQNAYPVPEARSSNMRHRPIGVGVQALADVFAMMHLPFDSEAAALLNRSIAEHIYFAALQESAALAAEKGPYETFAGSPAAQGLLQHDLWREQGHWDAAETPTVISEHEWATLRQDIKTHGLRNSLMVALMPTASTSQILGNNECFEPFTSNLYSRRTLAGEFVVANRHLQRDLLRLGLWNRDVVNAMMAAGGSVQGLPIPDQLKAVYRTVWEIPQKVCVDLALARGPFVDQTQSLNVFMAEPNAAKMSSMLFYAWRRGAKTGLYYLRTKPSAQPIQFTLRTTTTTTTPTAAPGNCPSSESEGQSGGRRRPAGSASFQAAEQEAQDEGVCESCSA